MAKKNKNKRTPPNIPLLNILQEDRPLSQTETELISNPSPGATLNITTESRRNFNQYSFNQSKESGSEAINIIAPINS